MNELLVQRTGAVLALTLNRPERLNAVTTDLVLGMVAAIEDASRDSTIRVVTLTGAGRAFCVGADIGPDTVGTAEVPPDAAIIDAVNRLALTIQAVPQLVIALVNGPAVGVGSSFALGADLAFASDNSYLMTGFSAIGLIPDGGGTAYLVASLGRSRALASAVLGDRIDAKQALEAGLFARVWPHAQFTEESDKLVRQLAAGPSRAYAAAKQAINGVALPNLAAVLETERRLQRELLATADFAEGVAAFVSKRPAKFQGR